MAAMVQKPKKPARALQDRLNEALTVYFSPEELKQYKLRPITCDGKFGYKTYDRLCKLNQLRVPIKALLADVNILNYSEEHEVTGNTSPPSLT